MAYLTSTEGRVRGPLAIVAGEPRGMCPDEHEAGEAAAQLMARLGALRIEAASE